MVLDQTVLPHVLLQVVEVTSGGAQIPVTNENKMHYLNLLAQYRLASQVRDEVEHFLKGKKTNTDAGCCCVHAVNTTFLINCRIERTGSRKPAGHIR